MSYIITPVGEPTCASELPSSSCAEDAARTVGFPVVWLPISTEFGPSGGDPLGFEARDQEADEILRSDNLEVFVKSGQAFGLPSKPLPRGLKFLRRFEWQGSAVKEWAGYPCSCAFPAWPAPPVTPWLVVFRWERGNHTYTLEVFRWPYGDFHPSMEDGLRIGEDAFSSLLYAYP